MHSPASTLTSTSGTIPSLDGIRAVSVLIVVLSHVGLGHVVPGGLGVTIFFFLSGYLITTLLLKEYDRCRDISIAKFYIRRSLRLGPPLLITLAVAYSLVWAGWLPGGVSWQGFAAQVFYMANYYYLFWDPGQTTPKGTGVLWSLAVEEHFYLVYPFLFFVLKRWLAPSRVGWVLMALSCVVLAWRYVLVGQPGFQAERTFYATDTRIDSIMWGCILALLANPWQGQAAQGTPNVKDWVGLGAGLVLLGVSLIVRDTTFRETFRYTVQGIALMPVFHFVVKYPQALPSRPLNWPFMMRLGVYSYAMYLIHFVIIFFLQERSNIFQNWVILLVSTLVLSILFAAAIERWVESRVRLARARFH
jgi:peptidoglycan/LPS O-acetylase OafA/YrhL